jgi:hypothetical protein
MFFQLLFFPLNDEQVEKQHHNKTISCIIFSSFYIKNSIHDGNDPPLRKLKKCGWEEVAGFSSLGYTFFVLFVPCLNHVDWQWLFEESSCAQFG